MGIHTLLHIPSAQPIGKRIPSNASKSLVQMPRRLQRLKRSFNDLPRVNYSHYFDDKIIIFISQIPFLC